MFRRFLYGRYGTDKLNFALAVLLIAFGIVSMFVEGNWALALWLVQSGVFVWFLFRMLSRNFAARRKEEAVFLGLAGKIASILPGKGKSFSDRSHKYFRCPKCKAQLRVPRGRGTITVTCPKCGNRFDKKS